MSKKSQDRTNSARPDSSRKQGRDGSGDAAPEGADESRPPSNWRRPRKNLPLLILSAVLLAVWLIVMLAIAILD